MITLRRIVILSLFGLFLYAACGPKPPIVKRPYKGSAQDILNHLIDDKSKITTVAQALKIKISTRREGEHSLNGTLYYKAGSYYLQLEATLGKDVVKLLIADDTLKIYFPLDNSFSVALIESPIEGFGLTAKDLLDLFIGNYGFTRGNTKYVGMVDEYYFYEMDDDKYINRITVRPELINVVGIRIKPKSKKDKLDLIDVRFADFVEADGIYNPLRITIIDRNRDLTMNVKIKSEKRGIELPDNLFKLKIPSNAEEVKSTWFWENF